MNLPQRIASLLLAAVLLVANTSCEGSSTKVDENDYVAYLFAYFTGNRTEDQGEAVRYAVSLDGYNYLALNKNRPVIDSKAISSTGGVRDPHVLRGHDGKTFYMVVTDMTASAGWDSNRAMVLLKSTDLINWQSSVVNIQQKYAGQEDLKRVWAPQTIYDEKAGKYMIYFSMKHGAAGPDIIYYAYANDDFTDLESEPRQLFFPENGKACIDGDIVLKDGIYHMFYKTEGNGDGIKVATTNRLTSGKWTEHEGYKQQIAEAVEGSFVFKLINSDKYILMYDVYKCGSYQFTESTDLENFKVIDNEISMNFHPRHGSIIPITQAELDGLLEKWGMPPGFKKTAHNPVINGFYADPEVLYAEKTGKYYIYPTSDGFDSWGGYYFKAFSSDNLTDWKDEGVILNLKRDLTWANRNAWAPAIIERKVGDAYKYYYYFTAAQKIGVAVADDPTGPFTDSGKALIDFRPQGVKGGQEIDPDVYYDAKSKKYYLYWGNGYLAVAELNNDMVSIKKNSVKLMTPRDGSFREGVYVFDRKGTYYFLWSENDTRNPNYRVRYGTSTSPLGPIEIPANNVVIEKDEMRGVYATGHNSVVCKPGTDEWYIVYHRFTYPDGIAMGDAAGFNREVCVDRMYFNEDGSIKKVVPTP